VVCLSTMPDIRGIKHEDYCPLKCDVVLLGRWILVPRWNVLLSSIAGMRKSRATTFFMVALKIFGPSVWN